MVLVSDGGKRNYAHQLEPHADLCMISGVHTHARAHAYTQDTEMVEGLFITRHALYTIHITHYTLHIAPRVYQWLT